MSIAAIYSQQKLAKTDSAPAPLTVNLSDFVRRGHFENADVRTWHYTQIIVTILTPALLGPASQTGPRRPQEYSRCPRLLGCMLQ